MKSSDYERHLKRFGWYWFYAALLFAGGAGLAIVFQTRAPTVANVGVVVAFAGVVSGIVITLVRMALTFGLFRSKVG
jgi:hypothetical protein